MSDLISRQDSIDALEAKKDKTSKGTIGQFYNTIIQHDIDTLMDLPSAQPEITEKDVQEWCYKRCLTVIDNRLFLEMRSRWSVSKHSERNVDLVRCKDCKWWVKQNVGGVCQLNILLASSDNWFCADGKRKE